MLPGGAEEGAEEIAESVPGQEVRHVEEGGKPEGDVAPVARHSDPILEWATNA